MARPSAAAPHPAAPPRGAGRAGAGAAERRQRRRRTGREHLLDARPQPGLFSRWLPFGGKLLGGGKLPARDRELLILRTGWLCHAEYEWAQHREISKSIGIATDEIARVREGPDAAGWDPFDATLLRAADELHADVADLATPPGRRSPSATTSSS